MKHKTLGQVFTPNWIVDEILDSIGFKNENTITKKIIDPACGDGAFLKNIVKRIIAFCLLKNCSSEKIKKCLEGHVYGIEIDEIEYLNCINNLNNLVKCELGETLHVNWKIFNSNTLIKYKEFLGFFDLVVGNPPYIRIHNLDKETRRLLKEEFIFSEGTIDIYISFFEIGFKLLNKKGQLGYITPNSYLHNSSYIRFRKYLKQHKAVKSIADFKANKIFKGFSTYTAITIINFHEKKDFFNYKELDDGKIKEINKIKYDETNHINWSFSNKKNMAFLKKLYSNTNKKVTDFFNVQYGFATLRDNIFVNDIEQEKENLALFNKHWIEKDLLYKIVKGSTYKGDMSDYTFIIFPYKKEHNRFVRVPENELKKSYPETYKYLLKHKEELEKRNMDKGSLWYEFGRSQGIQTIHEKKIVISTLIKDKINYYKIDDKTFVYSGVFITKKISEANWKMIEGILDSNDFFKYVWITGKDFSGGYKSLTSKQIKNFPTKELNHQQSIFC